METPLTGSRLSTCSQVDSFSVHAGFFSRHRSHLVLTGRTHGRRPSVLALLQGASDMSTLHASPVLPRCSLSARGLDDLRQIPACRAGQQPNGSGVRS
jgi:hypothetical protein